MSEVIISTGSLIAKRRDGQILQATGSYVSSGAVGGAVTPGMSAANILASLLTVDGTGSGLDADLLDGQHGNYYAPVDSPVFTTKINAPVINGSDAANGDISIKGTSHATKTTSYVKLQEDGGNVVIGSGGDENIRLLLVQGALADGLRIAADGEANLRLRGGATGEADIYLGANGKDNWAIWSTYDERGLRFSSVVSGSWVEKARFASDGKFMLGFIAGLAKLSINGGLHVGGESDPGNNNILADGEVKGASLKTANWSFEESGSDLVIRRGSTVLAKITSAGKIEAADNIQGAVVF